MVSIARAQITKSSPTMEITSKTQSTAILKQPVESELIAPGPEFIKSKAYRLQCRDWKNTRHQEQRLHNMKLKRLQDLRLHEKHIILPKLQVAAQPIVKVIQEHRPIMNQEELEDFLHKYTKPETEKIENKVYHIDLGSDES